MRKRPYVIALLFLSFASAARAENIALKLLLESVRSEELNYASALSCLAGIWEDFRPEDDFDGNGRPDVVDAIEFCAESMMAEDVLASSPQKRPEIIAGLSAADRILDPYAPELAAKAGNYASLLWEMKGGYVSLRDFDACLQMWFTYRSMDFCRFISGDMDVLLKSSDGFIRLICIYPLSDSSMKSRIVKVLPEYVGRLKKEAASGPYGIPELSSDSLLKWALEYYYVWKYFPGKLSFGPVPKALAFFCGDKSADDPDFVESMSLPELMDFVRLSLAVSHQEL